MSWRRLQNALKKSWRYLEDVSKTYWRRLEDVLKKFLQDVLKTSWRCLGKTSWRLLKNALKTSWRRMTKTIILVLIKTSWRRLLKTYELGEYIRLDQDVLKKSLEDEEERRFQDVFKNTAMLEINAPFFWMPLPNNYPFMEVKSLTNAFSNIRPLNIEKV